MRTSTIIAGLTAFAGGLVTGLLLTPRTGKENRKWLSNQTKDTRDWLESKSHRFLEESERRIDRVSRGIKDTLEENVPDLYSATETLNFSDYNEEDP